LWGKKTTSKGDLRQGLENDKTGKKNNGKVVEHLGSNLTTSGKIRQRKITRACKKKESRTFSDFEFPRKV